MNFTVVFCLALFSFWLTYNLRMKDCPFGLCKIFRKTLDFKPFSCFFCLSFWIYCVTLPIFYAISFVSLTLAQNIAYGLGGFGLVLLLHLFLNNHCPNEYNND